MGALDLPPKKWTGLGGHTLSESWADVAQRRMQAAGIVEALDIQEEVSAGLGAGTINPMVNPLGLEAVKEALHGALSRQSPLRLIEGVIPDRARASR